jgi:hypothetical protein
MRAIDRARTAFHATRDMVTVPEWPDAEGTPLEVYFTRLSAADVEAVRAREPKTDSDYNVLLLINKAKDEQGKNLFEFGDRMSLLHDVEYAVLLKIIGAMTGLGQPQTVDEAKRVLGEDGALQFRMQLAEHLHKSLEDVEQFSVTELTLWGAYFTLKAEEQERQEHRR